MRKQALFGICIFMLFSGFVYAQQTTEDYFRQNCYNCHTIGGGRITGPDLQDVTERKSRDWLIDFILDPQGVIDSGDPYAIQLLQEARGVVMPAIPGMTRDQADALLEFIQQESQKEESVFAGSQISDRPLTQTDIATGRQLFMGLTPLQNGGTSCISCHTTNGISGMLGGGTLGPNLSGSMARLGGRKGISSWLAAPPTPTMQATFQNSSLAAEEILPLVAYIQQQSQQTQARRSGPFINYLLFGLGGSVLLLVAFDFIWGYRFRAVRKPLVQSNKKSKKIQQDEQE